MVGGYVCTKCIIEYRPNQTPFKKADKLDLLGPATDSHGIVVGVYWIFQRMHQLLRKDSNIYHTSLKR